MNKVILVSYYRTYTHFFRDNLFNLTQEKRHINNNLSYYSTHVYSESLQEKYLDCTRFSLVRDPLESLASTLAQTGGSISDIVSSKRIGGSIEHWMDFHNDILKEKDLNLVWSHDLRIQPLKTFEKISKIAGLEMIRDTIIDQKNITDTNYRPTSTIMPEYMHAYRALSSTDLSKPYKLYSQLVKKTLII